MSECSFRWAGDEFEEALPVVTLWGRRWTRPELLAGVGRLEQVAGMRLVEGGDGAERGVRILRCTKGAGFGFEILVDRGFDIGGAWINGQPLAWLSGNAAEIASWGIDVIVSGSAMFGRVDPAGNLDLRSAQLRTPEEVSDGQR
jgi:Domain of unknown function (DUF4432)